MKRATGVDTLVKRELAAVAGDGEPLAAIGTAVAIARMMFVVRDPSWRCREELLAACGQARVRNERVGQACHLALDYVSSCLA